MKKLSIALFSFFILTHTALAAEVHLSSDKRTITTDDVLTIHLSVDGQIDNGQIGIEGLENFNIVGQQSSQQVKIINGETTSIQEKILSLQPKKDGNYTLTALAKENGNEIHSQSITVQVQKSLIQSTKEKLLQDTSENTNQEQVEEKTLGDNSLKNLLTAPQNGRERDTKNRESSEQLQVQKIENFPTVKHVSAFNMIFWVEVVGILTAFVILFGAMLWLLKKRPTKNKK